MGRIVIGSLGLDRDLNLGPCDVNLFCMVQCSHWIWNPSWGANRVSGNVIKSLETVHT